MGNFQAEWVLRLVCAVLAGILIGYERHNRAKAAGIRTHAIVALASCLLMIVSKHGFDGLISACPLLKSAQTRQGFAVVLPRSDKNLLRQNSEGLEMSKISRKIRCRKSRQAGACQN